MKDLRLDSEELVKEKESRKRRRERSGGRCLNVYGTCSFACSINPVFFAISLFLLHSVSLNIMPKQLLRSRCSLLLCACCIIFYGSNVSHADIFEDAPIQTPQFTPNITHRTDLCLKQRLFRGGLIEFQDVLRGMNLT